MQVTRFLFEYIWFYLRGCNLGRCITELASSGQTAETHTESRTCSRARVWARSYQFKNADSKAWTCRHHGLMVHGLLRKARGPILGEISYALAEITEIKLEIAKSSSLKRNHERAEIRNQSTIYKISVKSRNRLDTTSAN